MDLTPIPTRGSEMNIEEKTKANQEKRTELSDRLFKALAKSVELDQFSWHPNFQTFNINLPNSSSVFKIRMSPSREEGDNGPLSGILGWEEIQTLANRLAEKRKTKETFEKLDEEARSLEEAKKMMTDLGLMGGD